MKIKLFLAVVLVLVSAGCGRQLIKSEKKLAKLEHLNKYNASFAAEKNAVLLAVKKFSPAECAQVFGTNVIGQGYQPLQITISNLSQEAVYMSPTHISLPLASPKKVAKKCHWKTGELVTSASMLACIFYWPALIPTAYCGIKMQEHNAAISKNIVKYDVIECWDTITVVPLENISRIIFVPTHDYVNTFYFTLHSASGSMEFHVDLTQKQ